MTKWLNGLFFSDSLLESRATITSPIAGLTLIEVLIALAIISIALVTVIKTTAQNIQHTTYLQQKMIATWLGAEMLNEIQAHILDMTSGELEEDRSALGEQWHLSAEISATPNPQIKEITVHVLQKNAQLQQLTGYLYDEKS